MATFLHRLCLFGLLATTGFAMSNCQRQAAEEDAMMEEAAAVEAARPETRGDNPPADGLGTGGAGLEAAEGDTAAPGALPKEPTAEPEAQHKDRDLDPATH